MRDWLANIPLVVAASHAENMATKSDLVSLPTSGKPRAALPVIEIVKGTLEGGSFVRIPTE